MQGAVPCARRGAALLVHHDEQKGPCLMLVAGIAIESGFRLRDLWCLTLQSASWSCITPVRPLNSQLFMLLQVTTQLQLTSVLARKNCYAQACP